MLPESKEKCTIELPNGDKHELDLYEPTIGPKAFNGPQLYQKTGLFTFDPGFTSTASCVSAITYIDGEKGQLLYRGYSIDELAEHCTFLETCFLLLYGDLPDRQQLEIFQEKVIEEMLVHEKIKDFYKGFE
jgi:citrate synthase